MKEMVSFAQMAQSWLVTKRLQHPDRNGHSHAARVDDLIRFAAALTGNPAARGAELDDVLTTVDVGTFDEDAAYRAFASMIDAGLSASTVARTLSTVKNMTRWATRRGFLDDDPMVEVYIGAARAGTRGDDDREPSPVRAFTPDDVQALLTAAGTPTDTVKGAWPTRDVALITVTATCGPRVSELCALRLRHVVTGGDVAQLHLIEGTKRGKNRQVPVPAATLQLLDVWLRERAERLGDIAYGDMLFVRNDGRTIDRFFVDRLVRRCARDAGVTIPDGAATHALRHYFGVQLGLRGVPGPVVQQLFGHVDPRTTAGYQRADPSFLVAPLRTAGWL